MAFRAEEAKSEGLKAALNYFAGPHTNLNESEKEAASALIQKLSRLYMVRLFTHIPPGTL